MKSADGKVILCRSDYAKWKNPNTKFCENVEKFTWKTWNRFEVSLITFGATFLEIKAPDRDGEITDVLMGYESFKDCVNDRKCCFGSIAGPVTGVVNKAEFCYKGKLIRMQKNLKNKHWTNCGFKGINKVNWQPYTEDNDLILSHVTDGSEGFPGIVLIQIYFTVNATNTVIIKATARTNQVTPIDISYRFNINLAAHDAGIEGLMEHLVEVNSSKKCIKTNVGVFKGLVEDVTMVAKNGELEDDLEEKVTSYDLQTRRKVDEVIKTSTGTFECHYIVDRLVSDDPQFVARIIHPPKGRVLEIHANQKTFNFSTCSDFPKVDEKSEVVGNRKEDEATARNSTENFTLEYLRTKLTEKEIEFFRCHADTDSMKLRINSTSSDNQSGDCTGFGISPKDAPDEPVKGKQGVTYLQNSGIAFTSQNFPNAVNLQQNYSDIFLMPGQVYENVLVLKFSVHIHNDSKDKK